MKKTIFTTLLALMLTVNMQAADDTIRYVVNPVYISFRVKDVNTNKVKWTDDEAVTSFLKTHVSNIPEGYTFSNYRTNTDIKGFTHRDCRQIIASSGQEVEGRELIVHTDADGWLVSVTGDLLRDAPDVAKTAKAVTSQVAGPTSTSSSATPYVMQKMEPFTFRAKNFYHDIDDMVNPDITGGVFIDSLNNKQYVLYDPTRNIYTMDLSRTIEETNCKKYDLKPSSSTLFEKLIEKNIEDMIIYCDHFKSSTPDFGAEHDAYITRLDIDSINCLYEFPSGRQVGGEYKLEVRKCNDQDVDWKNLDYSNAFKKGTVLSSGTGTPNEEGTVPLGMDPIRIEAVCQRRDTNFDESYHTLYIAQLTCDTLARYCVLPSASQQNNSLYFNYDFTHMADLSGDYNDEDYDDDPLLNPYIDQKLTVKYRVTLEKAQPAIDVHWGMERVVDMYKDCYGINGYDNHGSPLLIAVNWRNYYVNNANAWPSKNNKFGFINMAMGRRDAQSDRYYPLYDVITLGHEFTHLVAGKLMDNTPETRALNESYADIMGLKAERLAVRPYSYMSGEKEVCVPSWEYCIIPKFKMPQEAARCFDNPNNQRNPKYYKGLYWDDSYDSHNWSGVQNHWFYLLCTGGDITPEKGDALNVTPISRDDAELITFASLMYFATPHENYAMARKNTIEAARLYFGADSQEMESVIKAWYAVGVGTDEWQPGMPTSVNAINNVTDTTAGTRKILKDGQLVIEKNGKRYNAAGLLVE